MRKFISYILGISLMLAATSCAKDAEYNQPLGLLSAYNVFSSSAGSTQVAVFSNTSWTVRMDREVSWASIDRFQGYKTGHLVFDYEVNYGRARRVILIFNAGGVERTLNMYQKAFIADDDCKMILGTTSLSTTAEASTETIPFETNLIYNLDEMYLTLTYPEGQEPETPWISLKGVEKDKIVLEIARNTSGIPRTAKVRMTHTDAGSYDSVVGDTVYSENTLTIEQAL